MRSFTRIAISALAVLQAASVNAKSMPECLGSCGNAAAGNFAPLGCANAQDFPCICKNVDFYNAIESCMQHDDGCTADENAIKGYLAQDKICGRFVVTTPSEAPSSKAGPLSTSAPATSTSAAAATTSQASTSDVSTTTSPAISEASAEATSSTTSVESTTSTGPATESTSAAAAAAGSGLSYAATVGIGVGVAAVVVAAAIIGFCILKNRKRNPKPRQSMDISKPLPGSGRTYPTRERQPERESFEKYEMTANRYEDMLPRTQPRTMV